MKDVTFQLERGTSLVWDESEDTREFGPMLPLMYLVVVRYGGVYEVYEKVPQ